MYCFSSGGGAIVADLAAVKQSPTLLDTFNGAARVGEGFPTRRYLVAAVLRGNGN